MPVRWKRPGKRSWDLSRDEAVRRELELHEPLHVPDEIQLGAFLGLGRRARIYHARYRGSHAIIKVYRQALIHKYRKRYGVDLARFEFDRNQAFYELAELRPYCVAPLAALTRQSGYTPAFVQGFAAGKPLLEVIDELGYLPDEILQAGRSIVQKASQAGLHDLDMSTGNIKAIQGPAGWTPVIYDFNLMPQHLHAPNPFMAAGFALGLRHKSHRDYRCLKNWQKRGRSAGRTRRRRGF